MLGIENVPTLKHHMLIPQSSKHLETLDQLIMHLGQQC